MAMVKWTIAKQNGTPNPPYSLTSHLTAVIPRLLMLLLVLFSREKALINGVGFSTFSRKTLRGPSLSFMTTRAMNECTLKIRKRIQEEFVSSISKLRSLRRDPTWR